MNEFTRVMSERSDEQLIEIITVKRHEYQPEALAAADEEFKRRELSTEVVEQAGHVIAERHTAAAVQAKAPLGVGWKVLSFLFPGTVVFFAVIFLKSKGHDRQSRELGRWGLYGVAFYLLIIVLATHL